MAKAEEKPPNALVGGVQFVKVAWDELKKVYTPSRQETIRMTMVVLMMVILCATLLGCIDFCLGQVMKWILT